MKHDLKALRDLEKRLAEAKGPDREIDERIAKMAGTFKIEEQRCAPGMEDYGIFGDTDFVEVFPLYTTSLDAAVALVERVLPVSFPTIDRYQHSDKAEHASFNWRAWIKWVTPDDHLHEAFSGTKETPALALCLACVRALIAQGEVKP